jgi:hypothetical protein
MMRHIGIQLHGTLSIYHRDWCASLDLLINRDRRLTMESMLGLIIWSRKSGDYDTTITLSQVQSLHFMLIII